MKLTKTLFLATAVISLAVLPTRADQPAATGKENAQARVESATSKHIDVLNDLLSKVPEPAQSAIEKALEASRKGRDAALAALSKVTPPEGGGSATGDSRPSPEAGKPDPTGLARARESVASAFEKSVSTLQGLVGKVPEQAVAQIQEALERVREHRAVALESLDRLIAGERTDRARTERPERGEKPERAERPDRPDQPERPQVPERPEAPDRPQPPERPDVPDRG